MKRFLATALVLGALGAQGADEITINASVRIKKGNLNFSKSVDGLKADLTGDVVDNKIIVVGTGTEAIVVSGDIGTNGISWFRNLSTNVTLTLSNVVISLPPGEIALFRLASTNLQTWSSTNTASLDALIAEE